MTLTILRLVSVVHPSDLVRIVDVTSRLMELMDAILLIMYGWTFDLTTTSSDFQMLLFTLS